MKLSEVELPSNKSFGFFITAVCLMATGYFFINRSMTIAYVFAASATVFLMITLVKPDGLLPLNKLWMQFGWLLGRIVSPLVLGLLFFGLLTPYGLVMRLFGRDELRLQLGGRKSHWKYREQATPQTDFKQQF